MSEVKRYFTWHCAEDGDVEFVPGKRYRNREFMELVVREKDYGELRDQVQRARKWLRHDVKCPGDTIKTATHCTCGLTAFLAKLDPAAS